MTPVSVRALFLAATCACDAPMSGVSAGPSPVPWSDPAWTYRRRITLDLRELERDLTEYQVEIQLTHENFAFSSCSSDGRDLRLTADDGVTRLDHWIEHFDPANGEGFLAARAPWLPAGDTERFYLYYGNERAPPSGDWQAAFGSDVPPPQIDWIPSGAGYRAFPGIARALSGELILSYRTGSAHISPDGRLMLARSLDEGTTWSFGQLFDGPSIDDRVDLGLTRLSTGEFLQPFYQHDGTSVTGCFLLRSPDAGASWSAPIPIRSGPLEQEWLWLATYGQILERLGGSLLLPAYGVLRLGNGTKSALLESRDGGWTWNTKSLITSDLTGFNESSVVDLGGDELLAVTRFESPIRSLYTALSHDGGQTWSAPQFLTEGVSPNLVRLSSGNVLLAAGDRTDVGAMILCASLDGGYSWMEPVWFDEVCAGHDIGYPATLEMSARPSRIVTAYYEGGAGLKRAIYSESFVAVNENFQNFLDGLEGDPPSCPNPWRLLGPPSAVGLTGAVVHSGATSLFLDATSGLVEPSAARRLGPNARAVGTVVFWLRPEIVRAGIEFGLEKQQAEEQDPRAFWFRILPDGGLERLVRSGPGSGVSWIPIEIAAVRLSAWNRISLSFDTRAGLVRLSLNGVDFGPVPSAQTPCGSIEYLTFAARSDLVAGDLFYVDDIYARQYEPSPIDVAVDPEEERPGPSLAFRPAELRFGFVEIGTADTLAFIAWNRGADMLRAISVIDGLEFSADPTDFVLAAAETAHVTVMFSPIVAGRYRAALRIESNAPHSPAEIALSGAGAAGRFAESDPSSGERTGLGGAAPRAFALEPNVPNPFGPETRIGFQLPRPLRVRFQVFDVSGRLVKVLADRIYPAGRHDVTWDGRDRHQRRVRPGLYLCRLEAEAYTATRRMVIVR